MFAEIFKDIRKTMDLLLDLVTSKEQFRDSFCLKRIFLECDFGNFH